MKKSRLVEDMDHCIFCTSSYPEEHHVFEGPDRKFSEKYGLKIPLCGYCHRESPNSPHRNKVVSLALKCWAQSIYEKEIGDRNDFRREFRKSYL